MKVVVWKGYGDVSVHAADTPQQLAAVMEEIMACLEGWDLDTTLARVRAHMMNHPDDWKELRRAFNTLVDQINPGYDNDCFEKLEITEVKGM